MDPIKLEMLREAAEVTEQQRDEFKFVSELLIEAGRVERLSEEQTLQAIDRLAYEIVKLSTETAIGLPHMSNEEVCAADGIKQRVEAMDEIMLNIAFGSGIHKAMIDVIVGERCDYWTEQYVQRLILMRK